MIEQGFHGAEDIYAGAFACNLCPNLIVVDRGSLQYSVR